MPDWLHHTVDLLDGSFLFLTEIVKVRRDGPRVDVTFGQNLLLRCLVVRLAEDKAEICTAFDRCDSLGVQCVGELWDFSDLSRIATAKLALLVASTPCEEAILTCDCHAEVLT